LGARKDDLAPSRKEKVDSNGKVRGGGEKKKAVLQLTQTNAAQISNMCIMDGRRESGFRTGLEG